MTRMATALARIRPRRVFEGREKVGLMMMMFIQPGQEAGSQRPPLVDDVYYYIRWRLKLEGETENMGVCTKERKGVTAEVLMATPNTNSLGVEVGGTGKGEGCGGRSACWKFAAVSWSGAGGRRC